MAATILVLNAGSSSIKFQLFAIGAKDLEQQFKGQIQGIGVKPHMSAKDAEGAVLVDKDLDGSEAADLPGAIAVLQTWLAETLAGNLPIAIGHRVVHGGAQFTQPVVIDDQTLAKLEGLEPLAPLHQPNNLAPIKAIRSILPDIPQVACFDTAFHRSHGELADRFALPESFYEEGVRRYGFHGLSYEYIAHALPELLPEVAAGRVVVAHLGSGASLCAVKAGLSMDSTMGFTAIDGLPMGTRPGQLDPGVVLYLVGQKGMSPKEVEHLLYHESGLKGLSGISNDVRDLLESDDPRAKLALDFFAFRTAKEVAALTTVLGGLDALVFTAGVGENAPAVRQMICARLSCLGVALDETANAAGVTRISPAGKTPVVAVIPTDEERMIARHTQDLVATSAAA